MTLPNEKKCTNCGAAMYSPETLSLRRGGMSGFMSAMGQLFESHFKAACYKCSNCGHLDFYEDQK